MPPQSKKASSTLPLPGSSLPDTNIIIRPPEDAHEWQAYFQLRWEILRKPWGQPVGSETDALEHAAYHVVAINKDKVVGVGRLHSLADKTSQIRYMAVDPVFRRQGIASQILRKLEEYAAQHSYNEIYLNARDEFIGFYVHHNYNICGKGETLFDTIKHTRMSKVLF